MRPAASSSEASLSDRIRGAVAATAHPHRQHQQHTPLRVLVVGDSLAAGIGQDPQSVLPVLPQSIAASLSQQLKGRPVYWTCVGSPGLSATEVVEVIHHDLPALRFPAFAQKLAEWQEHRRIEATERLHKIQSTAAQRFKSLQKRSWVWVSHIGQPVEDDGGADHHGSSEPNDPRRHEQQSEAKKKGRVSSPLQWARQRFRRARRGVERDVRNFRHVFAPSPGSGAGGGTNGEEDAHPAASDGAAAATAALRDAQKQEESDEENRITARRVNRMVHAHSLDPDFVNQYDVAIVLTGINDLKDAFLPFMMSPQRSEKLEKARLRQGTSNHVVDVDHEDEDDDDDGESYGDEPNAQRAGVFRGELLRIVEALRDNVLRSLPPHTPEAQPPARSSTSTPDATISVPRSRQSSRSQRRGPLIVFPALPLEPTELSQRAPLSWFVVPVVRGMDRNKQRLAELYPDAVLFVLSPPSDVFEDAENRRGPLWEGSQRETALLKLADISRSVRRRFQSLLLEDAGAPAAAAAAVPAEEDHNDGGCAVRRPGLEDSDYDDTTSATLYELCEDGVVLAQRRAHNRPRHPGSTMVSDDGIHPNDRGYELWGKFIARAIVEHWERERSSS
jgi:hypothetical protein